jgi:hypothetical protein
LGLGCRYFFGERTKVNAALVEVLNHGDEVAQAASEAIEFPDGECVLVEMRA